MQRKHSRSISQPDVHGDNLALDVDISGCLRGIERANSLRTAIGDPSAAILAQVAAAAPHQTAARIAHRKLLHEEIALLWTMAAGSAKDVVFSNAWYVDSLCKSFAIGLWGAYGCSCARSILEGSGFDIGVRDTAR